MSDNHKLPAFPVPERGVFLGLTKREYIAAKCLQGIIASPKAFDLSETESTDQNGKNKVILAVVFADQLLKELEETKQKEK